VIGEERPSVHRQGSRLRQRGQTGDEVGPIGVVPKEAGPFYAPHHHVVEDVQGVETRLAWHGSVSLA
jgi:hypothetical protein